MITPNDLLTGPAADERGERRNKNRQKKENPYENV